MLKNTFTNVKKVCTITFLPRIWRGHIIKCGPGKFQKLPSVLASTGNYSKSTEDKEREKCKRIIEYTFGNGKFPVNDIRGFLNIDTELSQIVAPQVHEKAAPIKAPDIKADEPLTSRSVLPNNVQKPDIPDNESSEILQTTTEQLQQILNTLKMNTDAFDNNVIGFGATQTTRTQDQSNVTGEATMKQDSGRDFNASKGNTTQGDTPQEQKKEKSVKATQKQDDYRNTDKPTRKRKAELATFAKVYNSRSVRVRELDKKEKMRLNDLLLKEIEQEVIKLKQSHLEKKRLKAKEKKYYHLASTIRPEQPESEQHLNVNEFRQICYLKPESEAPSAPRSSVRKDSTKSMIYTSSSNIYTSHILNKRLRSEFGDGQIVFNEPSTNFVHMDSTKMFSDKSKDDKDKTIVNVRTTNLKDKNMKEKGKCEVKTPIKTSTTDFPSFENLLSVRENHGNEKQQISSDKKPKLRDYLLNSSKHDLAGPPLPVLTSSTPSSSFANILGSNKVQSEKSENLKTNVVNASKVKEPVVTIGQLKTDASADTLKKGIMSQAEKKGLDNKVTPSRSRDSVSASKENTDNIFISPSLELPRRRKASIVNMESAMPPKNPLGTELIDTSPQLKPVEQQGTPENVENNEYYGFDYGYGEDRQSRSEEWPYYSPTNFQTVHPYLSSAANAAPGLKAAKTELFKMDDRIKTVVTHSEPSKHPTSSTPYFQNLQRQNAGVQQQSYSDDLYAQKLAQNWAQYYLQMQQYQAQMAQQNFANYEGYTQPQYTPDSSPPEGNTEDDSNQNEQTIQDQQQVPQQVNQQVNQNFVQRPAQSWTNFDPQYNHMKQWHTLNHWNNSNRDGHISWYQIPQWLQAQHQWEEKKWSHQTQTESEVNPKSEPQQAATNQQSEQKETSQQKSEESKDKNDTPPAMPPHFHTTSSQPLEVKPLSGGHETIPKVFDAKTSQANPVMKDIYGPHSEPITKAQSEELHNAKEQSNSLADSYLPPASEKVQTNIPASIGPLPVFETEKDLPLSALLRTIQLKNQLETYRAFIDSLKTDHIAEMTKCPPNPPPCPPPAPKCPKKIECPPPKKVECPPAKKASPCPPKPQCPPPAPPPSKCPPQKKNPCAKCTATDDISLTLQDVFPRRHARQTVSRILVAVRNYGLSKGTQVSLECLSKCPKLEVDKMDIAENVTYTRDLEQEPDVPAESESQILVFPKRKATKPNKGDFPASHDTFDLEI